VDELDDSFIVFPTLDYALEWCENKILAEQEITDITGDVGLSNGSLEQAFPELHAGDRMMKYLELLPVKQGEYLIHKGDPPTEMYFILSGLVTVQLELPSGKTLRLGSIRGGATVGEMGLYLGAKRTADAVVTRPGLIYCLTKQALKDMVEKDPEVASHLHEWIARLLAELVTDGDHTIEALMD